MARKLKASKSLQKTKSTSSTTLLDYFTPGASSSSKKTPVQTPLKTRVKQYDIIVIDSDEDDTPSTSAGKRRISPDAEFTSPIAQRRRLSPDVPFGRPTLLLSSPLPEVHSRAASPPLAAASISSAPLFGQPNHLLGGLPPKPQLEHESVELVAVDDEWATGDDEKLVVVSDDDDNADDDDEVEIIASHILRDTQTSKTPSSKPKPLQRLSSIPPPSASNAFSILMTSRKENEAWKEATVAEQVQRKGGGGRRKAPFYKVLQGMPIAVDAFKYGAIPGITAYFLTHAHSDHYTNLSSTWAKGPIYCSEGTANLIVHMLKVDKKWVHPLPMDVPTTIPDTNGVQVTLIEANHCPGSSLFLFEGKQTVNAGDSAFKSIFVGSPKIFRYLHCGDFRASPQHVMHPAVKGKRIDHVYLDTTYLDPKYTFPSQPQVISACADLAKYIAKGSYGMNSVMENYVTRTPSSSADPKAKDKEKRVLMVVGTYTIGKERIVKAMANALHTKIYCPPHKAAILRCQCDPELHALLTNNPLDASVHIVPLGTITSDKIKDYADRYKTHFDKVVAFRPTGWTYSPPADSVKTPTIKDVLSRMKTVKFAHTDMKPSRNSTDSIELYMVPYSEHSSFSELTCFAMSFQWVKMIATVNVGNENHRQDMAQWVRKWEEERQKMNDKDYIEPYRDPNYW